MDDEEELMDIVAARSWGDNIEAKLRKLERLESEAKQREQATGEQKGRSFRSSWQHPSTTGNNSTGEEIREEEKEDHAFILKVVQEQIKNHRQVTSETPAADADLDDELAFSQPRLTSGQNQSHDDAMHPGAYAAAPGTDLQRTTTLSRSLVGATSSSHELSVADGELGMPSTNARNQSMADDQATTPTDDIDGLVVANQVEENEEPTQIARLDHSHGKNRSTTMTLLISVLIGSLLMVGVIVGSVCGAGLCSNKEGDVETQAPTSFRYFVLEDIQNRIEEAFGPDYFPENDEPEPTQPKFKALDWIVFEDPLQLNPDANNVLQRFIVVLTYFQTSQVSDWLHCGPSTTANDASCRIEYFSSDLLGSWWLTGVHECQWAGILCDREKNITELVLSNNGLNGPLPIELASLPTLESINFMVNQLTGNIPSIYGSFLSLSTLILSHNELSGSIPVELFGNKLSSLSFANNSLTGTLPTEVGLFDGTVLQFGSNSLSGSIPTELFQARRGNRLDLFFENNEVWQPFLENRSSVIFNFWSRA
ncbi:receptor-like protein kinase [Seminavis robusta]|uniref:Receptor-like protein kinase n=1 Tax=Seminavis robusta TaxID=568900 RepID=A0A9N8H6P8_9STRA|nr:receptor-like protein kinase [Seminavis robusta]|eukprot:Sro106_g053560.1 receptor-like protein kinase (538) ;mRNA; r:62424-64125